MQAFCWTHNLAPYKVSCGITEHQEVQNEPQNMCPNLNRDTNLNFIFISKSLQHFCHNYTKKVMWNFWSKWSHLQAHLQIVDTENGHFAGCCPCFPLCAWIWTQPCAAGHRSAAAFPCRVMRRRLGGALDVLGRPGTSLFPAEQPKMTVGFALLCFLFLFLFMLFNLLQRFKRTERHNPKGS